MGRLDQTKGSIETTLDASPKVRIESNRHRHDSTVAESVAVDSRKQNNLPDRRIGRMGPWAGRLRPRELEDFMQAFGMLLLAAATAGDGFGYGEAGVHLKKWLRPHAVTETDATGTPPYNAAQMAGPGAGGAASGRRFMVTKSQIYFLDPGGMQIGWQTSTGPNGERTYLPAQLTVPARYNFNQGFIYRLKITKIQGRPAVALYPTIEVAPTTPGTDAYLAHNAIPVQFTAEDFDQVVDGGNFVTKVIYLPDPKYQELAISGVGTLVSTRLERGVDPILEADNRGTILLIVRLGAIDLEMAGSATAGAPIVVGGDVTIDPAAAPGNLPAGAVPAPPGTVILDRAPTPAPTTPPQPAANSAHPARPGDSARAPGSRPGRAQAGRRGTGPRGPHRILQAAAPARSRVICEPGRSRDG